MQEQIEHLLQYLLFSPALSEISLVQNSLHSLKLNLRYSVIGFAFAFVMHLVRTQCLFCFVSMLSNGHILIEYEFYPVCPHVMPQNLHLSSFYFEMFLILLLVILCSRIECCNNVCGCLFINCFLLLLYFKHRLFDFWWSLCNCDIQQSWVDPHRVESIVQCARLRSDTIVTQAFQLDLVGLIHKAVCYGVGCQQIYIVNVECLLKLKLDAHSSTQLRKAPSMLVA